MPVTLSHDQVWAAIDRLAESRDLSPSGLAKRAGLDSTTFNKSKRFAADGRARWPSTESIAKVIDATGVSTEEFFALMSSRAAPATAVHMAARAFGFADPSAGFRHRAPAIDIPVLGIAQAGAGGFFDDAGYPVGQGWDRVRFPSGAADDQNVYALEISGDSMLPLYRDGDTIIVCPDASLRRGDRVVVRTSDGEVMAKILKRQTNQAIELSSTNPDHPDRTIEREGIDWIARIVWVSQ